MWLRAAGSLLLLFGSAGCKPRATAASDAGARPVAVPPAPVASAPVAARKGVFLDVALSDAAPLLAGPPGARVLEEPHVFGPRVEASYCGATDAETVRATLATAGWPDASVTPVAGMATRMLIAGHRGRLVLAGFMDEGVAGCDSTYVALGVHAPGPDADRPPATANQPRISGNP